MTKSVWLTKPNVFSKSLQKKKSVMVSDLVQKGLNEMKCDRFYDRIL